GEEKHDAGQHVTPGAARKILFIPPHHEERQGCHQSRRRWNWKPEEFLATAGSSLCGQTIESRQTEGAADQINRGDEPAYFRMLRENVFQHDAMDQKRRRDAEGNDVSQRIELPAEG